MGVTNTVTSHIGKMTYSTHTHCTLHNSLLARMLSHQNQILKVVPYKYNTDHCVQVKLTGTSSVINFYPPLKTLDYDVL